MTADRGGNRRRRRAATARAGKGAGKPASSLANLATRLRGTWPPWVVALLLACLAFGVYCSNGRTMPTGDTIPAALTPIVLITDGTLAMDAYRDYYLQHGVLPHFFIKTGHGVLSSYPILTGLVLTPLYVVPVLIYERAHPRIEDWVQFALDAGKLSAALITAAGSAVFYLLALRLGVGRRWALALTLAQAFATEAWSTSSQALWQHALSVLAILLAILLALRQTESATVARAVAFGTACALAVAARPTNLMFALPIFCWTVLRPAPRRVAVLLASAAAPLAIGGALAAYNVLLLRGLGGGYRWAWSAAPLGSLAGLLWSPGRGLLLYFPLALLGIAGLVKALRDGAFWRTVYLPLAAFVVAHLALMASFSTWWGGYCFGPRQLSEIQPILLLLAVPLLQVAPVAVAGAGQAGTPGAGRLVQVAFWVLWLWSVALQAVGAFLYTGNWNAAPVSVDAAPERLWDWRDNPVMRDLSLRSWHTAAAPPTPLEQWSASYRPPPEASLHAGEVGSFAVQVTNLSTEAWIDDGEQSGYGTVLLSYRLHDPQGKLVAGERPRTRLGQTVGPGEAVWVRARVEAPAEPGRYRVAFTLLQEGVDWFDARGVGSGHMDLQVLPSAAVRQAR